MTNHQRDADGSVVSVSTLMIIIIPFLPRLICHRAR